MKPVSISPRTTCGCVQQRLEEGEIGRHARDLEAAERLDQAVERLRAIGAPRDQLRQQRIVVGRDRVAGAKAGIDADALTRRLAPARG